MTSTSPASRRSLPRRRTLLRRSTSRTRGGRLPWLVNEVWEQLAFRLVEGATSPYRREPTFKPPIMAQLCKQVARLVEFGVLEELLRNFRLRCNNMLLMVPKPHAVDEWRLVDLLSGFNAAATVCDDLCTLPKDPLARMQHFKGCRLFSSIGAARTT